MQVTTLPHPPTKHGKLIEVAPDVACLPLSIVNVYFIGLPGAGDREWVLVDAGLSNLSGRRIAREAAERFGPESRPSAIILTHGHFDHVGAVHELARYWAVPVYAHKLEMPYVTGQSSYPPPDPVVGGGIMSLMSWLYPRGPIDLDGLARVLPIDGHVPELPGWRWIHTPGHTPGHISLFRDSDRTLIAGDAFVTTRQESLIGAITKRPPAIHRPPAYFTPDWSMARHSVELLAGLEPRIAATGHGRPMEGPRMRRQLNALARDFTRIALPQRGRYVQQPAVADERGVVFVPPRRVNWRVVAMAGIGVVAGFLWIQRQVRA